MNEIKSIKLREACLGDGMLLWQWRNDENTREASFNNKFIEWEEHIKWFKDKLKNNASRIYIILIGSMINNRCNISIGQIRLDPIENGSMEISISIDSKYRRQGYGTATLELMKHFAFENYDIKELIGYIKPSNLLSIKMFNKAGYRCERIMEIENSKSPSIQGFNEKMKYIYKKSYNEG